MKISIIYSGGFAKGGATITRLGVYEKGLEEKGHDVEILLFHASGFHVDRTGIETEGDFESINFKSLSGDNNYLGGIVARMVGLLNGFWGSFKYVLKNKARIDVIFLYCPNILRFFPVILAAKYLSIPIIVEQTELASLFINRKGIRNKIVKVGHLMTERFSSYFCDHLFVISTYLYDFYSDKFTKTRLTLIPIFVDMDRFNVEHRSKTLRIGHLGSFAQKDRVEGLLNAFCKAVKRNPGLKLRLIGKPQNLQQIDDLKNVVSRNNVDEKVVEFTGMVSDEAIPCLLAECDLLVVNRSRSKYATFGFPSKLGEYMATGRPVIASRVGDIEKYLTDDLDSILIEPENDDRLAEKILLRYKEYDKYLKVGEMGKRTCKKYFDYKSVMEFVDMKIRVLATRNVKQHVKSTLSA